MGGLHEPRIEPLVAWASEGEMRAQADRNSAELRLFLASLGAPAGGGRARSVSASAGGSGGASNVDDEAEDAVYASLFGVDAHGRPVSQPAASRTVAASGSSTALTYRSQWSPGVTVSLDSFSRNIWADDLQQANPTLWKLALRDGPVPKMFAAGGDVPIVTASGLDPQLLLKVPALCRHAIAAEPSLARASTLLQDAAANPDDVLPCQGLSDYRMRLSRWASGADLAAKTPQV